MISSADAEMAFAMFVGTIFNLAFSIAAAPLIAANAEIKRGSIVRPEDREILDRTLRLSSPFSLLGHSYFAEAGHVRCGTRLPWKKP